MASHNLISYTKRFVQVDVNNVFDLYTNRLIDCGFDIDWKNANFRYQFSTTSDKLLLLHKNCIQILDVSKRKMTASLFPDKRFIRNAIFNPFNHDQVLVLF